MVKRIAGMSCMTVVLVALGAAPALAGERYVALGDSFSSGTGTRTYYDTACQRSVYAYPSLVDVARANTDLVFAACSGARTGDVLNTQVASLTVRHALGHDHDRRQRRGLLERHHAVRAAVLAVELHRRDRYRAELHPQHAARAPGPRLQRDQVALAVGDGHRAVVPAAVHGRGLQRRHVVQLDRDDAPEPDRRPPARRHTRARDCGRAELPLRRRHRAVRRTCGVLVDRLVNGLSSPTSESFHPNRTGQSSGYAPPCGP